MGYARAQGVADPEDLVGEVFLKLVASLPRFEGDEAGFRSWVFVIAHHRILDERRRRSRRPEELVPAEDLPSPPVPDAAEEAGSREEVLQLLAVLTPDQRDVVLLRILGGLSAEEVARAMGRRVGAVKALQHRALVTLRRHLEQARTVSG